MIRFFTVLFLVFFVMSETVWAQVYKRPDDMDYFKQKEAPTEISAESGYLYLRLGKTSKKLVAAPTFIRQLSETETAAYDVVKQEQFSKAKAKNEKKRGKRIAAKAKAEKEGLPYTKTIPSVLTYDRFVFEYEDVRNVYQVVSRKEYRKTDYGRDMFFTLTPGNYVLYDVGGVCMCLGTVQFDVKPGEITDLGMIVSDVADRKGEVSVHDEIEALTKDHGVYRTGFPYLVSAVRPYTPDMEFPDELSHLKRKGADYVAKGKMQMYFSTMLDRLPAIPGVLSYRADKVVDARTGRVLE